VVDGIEGQAPSLADDLSSLLVAQAAVEPGRDRRTASHDLLRTVLTRLTGRADHELVPTCGRCGGGDHGKPVLAGSELHVSLASTVGLAVVAVTPVAPVGVDVERAAATGFDGFAEVALAPGEHAGTDVERARAWVRKEAVLKATGTGLAVDPRTVDVRADRLTEPPALLYDVPAPEGLACAVAVLGIGRPTLRVEQVDLSL
jgi:4'-phosphopantetheinyl transferase